MHDYIYIYIYIYKEISCALKEFRALITSYWFEREHYKQNIKSFLIFFFSFLFKIRYYSKDTTSVNSPDEGLM